MVFNFIIISLMISTFNLLSFVSKTQSKIPFQNLNQIIKKNTYLQWTPKNYVIGRRLLNSSPMYMRHSIIVNSEQDHITIKLIFITTRKTIFFVTTLNIHWILLQCRLPIPQFSDYHCILFPKSKCLKGLIFLTGAYRRTQEFVQGGLHFFSFQGGSAPVGAWKPPEINRFH